MGIEEGREIQTHLLREISFGVRENFPRGTSAKEARRIVAKQKGIPVEDVADAVEQEADVHRRQLTFLELLREHVRGRSRPGNQSIVLCVSHGGFLRSFLYKVFGAPSSSIANCSISRVEIRWDEMHRDSVEFKPQFTMLCINSIEHLEQGECKSTHDSR